MLRIRVTTASAEILETELITAGRRGLQCTFAFSDDWEGLAKTVIVRGVVKRDIVLVGDTIAVPGECLEREQFPLHIGVYGANGEGEIVIPTIWADFGKIRPSARPSGVSPDEVTPNVVAQIQQNSSTALYLASLLTQRANNGEFNGKDGATGATGPQGPQGQPGLGFPAGGKALAVLRKKTGADYDTEWANPMDLMSDEVKQAILEFAEEAAYAYPTGMAIYTRLYNAFYPSKTVVLLTAVFDQGTTVIYDDTALNDLKQHLTVTAKYDDNTTTILPDSAYTLSGLLEAPSSTVTVLYSGVSTTFTVAVTARPTLSSITAVYTQGNRTVFSNDGLDSLIPYLAVTANYSDGTTETVSADDYTLNGELTAGTSTITVSYGGKTDTFDVTVTAFVIPEGYTRYGYIEKKNSQNQAFAKDRFIFLNAQPDMNVLSFEAILGRKSGLSNDASGWFGIRNGTAAENSYACYCDTTNRTGIHFWVRGVDVLTDVDLSSTPSKVELINPAASPGFWRINDGQLHEFEWTTSPSIPYGLGLFNNHPYNSSSNLHMNWEARIGDIILRKADGECVGYYVPTVYDGKIGMYDVISAAFYTASYAAGVTIANSGCLYSVGNWE